MYLKTEEQQVPDFWQKISLKQIFWTKTYFSRQNFKLYLFLKTLLLFWCLYILKYFLVTPEMLDWVKCKLSYFSIWICNNQMYGLLHDTTAAVSCSANGYMLGGVKKGALAMGKQGLACVGAWHGAWLSFLFNRFTSCTP